MQKTLWMIVVIDIEKASRTNPSLYLVALQGQYIPARYWYSSALTADALLAASLHGLMGLRSKVLDRWLCS